MNDRLLKARKVAGYAMLPGLLPRIRDLFGRGTGPLAFLVAYILQSAHLLPANHPYLNPANAGRFGIRDVFAQASNNLVFDRKHIDQIIVFFTLIAAFVLFVIQFFFLILGMASHPAHAAAGGFAGIFTTANPTYDIAFELLDRVFGVPDFFDSCVAQQVPCSTVQGELAQAFPSPFQTALQGLFQFYSLAMLIVAVIIVLYYVVVIVAETAQTGTPFGRRFNHLWSPLRLVVAVGLLVPINYGYNSAQWIVLAAAKLGSGFATNGWLAFNQGLTNGLGVDDASLFARPKVPDSWPITKFMLMAKTCEEAYSRLGVTGIQPYLVRSPLQNQVAGAYADALAFYNNGDVVIRFGLNNPPDNGADDGVDKGMNSNDSTGGVIPYCGEVVIKTTAAVNTGYLIGPYTVQDYYFQMILTLWTDMTQGFADIVSYRGLPANANSGCNGDGTFSGADCTSPGGIQSQEVATLRENAQMNFEAGVEDARDQMVGVNDLAIPQDILDHGWGGAGIWYNRIAEINGAYFTAVAQMPIVSLLPLPLEQILKQRKGGDQSVSADDIFTPNMGHGGKVEAVNGIDEKVSQVLYKGWEYVKDDDTYQDSQQATKGSGIKDFLNHLLPLNGLFDLRENADIHPLAQLVGLGKSILDTAVSNLFVASLFSAGGGIAKAFGSAGIGKFADVLSSAFSTIATISLTIGFILYYVLPFMPFIYFFFAVGSWIKAVFEAMVGVPLWALAHLRIDGNGLPGPNAMIGYELILEIFLRPILTVFGLVGSLIIFAATVKVLNSIFDLVTANLAGFDENPCTLTAAGGNCAGTGTDITTGNVPANLLQFKRDVIDEFMFTIMYTMIVYMLGTSSFKLIDEIPRHVMRWMGSGMQAFTGDDPNHPIEGTLNQYVAATGAQMTSQLSGSLVGNIGRGAEAATAGVSKLVQRQGGNVAARGGE